MRVADLLIINCLKNEPGSTAGNIREYTGSSAKTVNDALRRLIKDGVIEYRIDPRGHHAKQYSIVKNAYVKDALDTTVCGKRFLLTAAQMAELRRIAEGYHEKNIRDGRHS